MTPLCSALFYDDTLKLVLKDAMTTEVLVEFVKPVYLLEKTGEHNLLF